MRLIVTIYEPGAQRRDVILRFPDEFLPRRGDIIHIEDKVAHITDIIWEPLESGDYIPRLVCGV